MCVCIEIWEHGGMGYWGMEVWRYGGIITLGIVLQSWVSINFSEADIGREGRGMSEG